MGKPKCSHVLLGSPELCTEYCFLLAVREINSRSVQLSYFYLNKVQGGAGNITFMNFILGRIPLLEINVNDTLLIPNSPLLMK